MNLYYPDIWYHCNLVFVIENKIPKSISSAPTISYAITNETISIHFHITGRCHLLPEQSIFASTDIFNNLSSHKIPNSSLPNTCCRNWWKQWKCRGFIPLLYRSSTCKRQRASSASRNNGRSRHNVLPNADQAAQLHRAPQPLQHAPPLETSLLRGHVFATAALHFSLFDSLI